MALLEAVMPSIVAVGLLYGLCAAYGAEFKDFFVGLSILSALLALLLPRGQPSGRTQLVNSTIPLAMGVVMRWMMILAILLAIGFITKYSVDFSRRVVLTWAVATPAAMIIVTLCLHELKRRLLYDPSAARRVAFAGCNEVSLSLARRMGNGGSTGMTVEGFFDDRSAERLGLAPHARLLGTLPDLAAFVKRNKIDVVFVALPVSHIRRVVQLLDELRDTTASVYYVPDIFAIDLIQARSGELLGIPVVALCETPFYGYRGAVKRIIDIALAAMVLLVAMPLMLALAVLVRVSSPGPAIFKQRRYGLDGHEFVVYKFRTMTVTEDGVRIAQATRDDRRITAIGGFLRRHSLDELPQLINVLQGRMSLVGPRPHAIAHNEEYRKVISGYMIRHKVLPGITGLAQISGCRGETAQLEEMRARVQYDLEYLRHWSPALDLKILALTAWQIVKHDKAY
jgi:putative colanic acid biosysnthesis UDP-glucose lipid carrier transferase